MTFKDTKIPLYLVFSLVGTIALISIFLYLNDADLVQWITAGWVAMVAVMVWLGNRVISSTLESKLPWLKFGVSRFMVQITINVIYSLAVINISYAIFKYLFTEDPPTFSQFIVMNAYGALIIIPISSIYFGIYFLRSWTKSQLEAERLEKESTKAQLQTLRNHLDPHFLFNNLNILSALIDTDARQSQRYLEKFAEVYRVILQSDKEELVTVSNEIQFIESYLYLVKIRFGELLSVEVNVSQLAQNKYIPPLTIQMLIENALKHNTITEDDVLHINITDHHNFLQVSNTLNRKSEIAESNGSGLKNIELRYSYYTDEKMEIKEEDGKYIVKIPLIDLQYESSDF